MSDFYMIMSQPIHLPYICHCYNFFAKNKGNSFTTPSLFTRPCPFPFSFLSFFWQLKTFLTGQRYWSWQVLGSAVYLYLTGIPKSAYHDAFRKFVITYSLNIPAPKKKKKKKKKFFSNTPVYCMYPFSIAFYIKQGTSAFPLEKLLHWM